MPTTRFHIAKEKTDKAGLAPLFLAYENGGRVLISIKLKIRPADFQPDTVKTWVKHTHGAGAHALNKLLEKIKGAAEEVISEFYLSNDRYPTCAEFKRVFAIKRGDKSEFFDLFDRFVQYQSSKAEPVSAGTLINYNKTKNRLLEYEKHTGQPLSFSAITVDFAAAFPTYCRTEFKNVGNTIGTYIKIIKAFLLWSERHHNIKLNKLAMHEMKVRREEKFFVTLQPSEFNRLYALDLSFNPLWDKVRDSFCLECLIGCRHQDLANMLLENIIKEDDGYYVRLKTKKNEKILFMPLSDMALRIIQKYKDTNPMLWIPDNNTANQVIKKACKLAEINERVQQVVDTGVHRQEKSYYKFELITTHTARRTFINLMKRVGIDDATVVSMTRQSIGVMQQYKHADTSEMKHAMNKFESLLGRAKDSPEPREAN